MTIRLPSFFRPPSRAILAAVAAVAAGCASPCAGPAETDSGPRGSFTLAEMRFVWQRLVDELLSDPIFARHYADKLVQKGGAVPVVHADYIMNETGERMKGKLDAVREDVADALWRSGRFELSEGPNACDYVLKGECRGIPDGRRVTYRLSLRLYDTASNLDVWTGSGEIAKE